eukprot:6314160-Amphidinium_carterae.1
MHELRGNSAARLLDRSCDVRLDSRRCLLGAVCRCGNLAAALSATCDAEVACIGSRGTAVVSSWRSTRRDRAQLSVRAGSLGAMERCQ